VISPEESGELVRRFVSELGARERVLLVPPDATRLHSGAGELSARLFRELTAGGSHVEVMPALGTHVPMSDSELERFLPGVPRDRILSHDFRRDLVTLGEVPASFVREVSEGRVDYSIPCQVNRRLVDGKYDRIVSVGQLVPHEVIGIANHNKNVFVGVGGKAVIDCTHFLGAVVGLERLMGEAHTPVRDVLNYMEHELGSALPIAYLLTVREAVSNGSVVTRGVFAGEGDAPYLAGAPLARRVNVTRVPKPLARVLVELDATEYHSTWLANKAIYRTRRAIAEGGELVVLAPGVERFGEDPAIDALIRRHGYRGTESTLAAVKSDPELAASLSAAAHLIHGSSEGRFRVTYAAGGLSREEVEGVGFEYASPESVRRRYPLKDLVEGENLLHSGESVYFIRNPGLGLWAS
jgi:nickel-dependent lactate racemase